jgi:hypothetical protein
MKAQFTFLAVPLMLGVAMAQAGQTGQSGAPDQTTPKSNDATAAPTHSSDKPAEMKTMTYKGTLVDLACNGTTNTASTTPSDTSAASNPASASTSNSANRSAGDSSCAVSANTSTFGLKTDQGQTYRFDLVGNQRAQDEFKNNKHWNSAGSKPLKVKISGVVQGDKLIVSSIH